MTPLMWIHFAGGLVALLAGALAIAARKGGPAHAAAGRGFVLAMLVLAVTAAILEPMRTPPGSPMVGVLVGYFVVTAWVAARRRSGEAGVFEKVACAVMLVIAAAVLGRAIQVASYPAAWQPIPGAPALFALGGVCLLAGLLDLRVVLMRRLSPPQRISRHLWRMCFAFFIATGSFFLGQQDVLPEAVRGSPVLIVLAFAPFAAMLFWLVRVRFSRTLNGLRLRPERGPKVPSVARP